MVLYFTLLYGLNYNQYASLTTLALRNFGLNDYFISFSREIILSW